MLYPVRSIRLGGCLPSNRLLRNNQRKGDTMTVTSNAPEPTDRRDDLNELQTGSSPHIIEFFTVRDQMISESDNTTGPFGYSHATKDIPFRREFSNTFSDPAEDWLYSLISGAALLSLLIWILGLPSFTAPKMEHSKPRTISHAESSVVTQKPG
jgi:hypothetical protein